MEKERDFGGGLARREVVINWIAVVKWFNRHKRGIRRLILVTSSCVNVVTTSILVARFGISIEAEKNANNWCEKGEMVMDFDGLERKRNRRGLASIDFIFINGVPSTLLHLLYFELVFVCLR
jgi:hypothetical protein